MVPDIFKNSDILNLKNDSVYYSPYVQGEGGLKNNVRSDVSWAFDSTIDDTPVGSVFPTYYPYHESNDVDAPVWNKENANEILEATKLFNEYKDKGILVLHVKHKNEYLRNLIAWYLEGLDISRNNLWVLHGNNENDYIRYVSGKTVKGELDNGS